MAFTAKDNQMISAKISLLRGEGYPEDQAIAIALDMFRRGTLPAISYPPVKQRRKKQESLAQFRKRIRKLKKGSK